MKKTKLPLRFHRNGTFCGDGTFRILLLSDLHGGTYCSPKLFRAIDALLTETSPDLVLLGGDLLDPGCFDDGVCTADTLRAYLSCILEPLSRRGIPFAVTIGDSDRACGMTAEELFAVYGESPLCTRKRRRTRLLVKNRLRCAHRVQYVSSGFHRFSRRNYVR